MLTNWATNGVSELHFGKLVFMLFVLVAARLLRRSLAVPSRLRLSSTASPVGVDRIFFCIDSD